MPRLEVQLRINPAEHPLAGSHEITIRNIGSANFEVWTDRPSRLASFLDCEVVNDKGERVSRVFQWQAPAEPGATSTLVETILAGKNHSASFRLFAAVPDASLLPGKYKVRIRFQYREFNVVSDWQTVEVLEAHIRTKHLAPGR